MRSALFPWRRRRSQLVAFSVAIWSLAMVIISAAEFAGVVTAPERVRTQTETGLIAIDAGLADFQVFVDGALPGNRVVLLDPNRDEIRQIGEALFAAHCQGQPISQIHIVSHGRPGAIRMGGRAINSETLTLRAEELSGWHPLLGPDAEILLYGCETGTGALGRAFLGQWSQLTGAKVAGSTNLTGPARLAGDWRLEASIGRLQGRPAFDLRMLEEATEVLADFAFYHDGTAGKLYKTSLDGTSPTAILTYNGSFSTAALDAVLVDPIHNVLYYNRIFNDVNRGLYKTDFSGTSPVRISPNTTNLISGQAVDFVNNRIYLHDDTAGKWYRCNLDGSSPTVLASLSANVAFAAVDTKNSALYYTQTVNDANRGLYKTDLAMTTAGTRISSGTDAVSGVALDLLHDKVYFHDLTTGQIIQAQLDGSSPVNKLALSTLTPLVVDVVNSRVYYCVQPSGLTRGLYRSADLDLGSPVRISTSTDAIGGIGITAIYIASPSINSVAGPTSGSYKIGGHLDFTVNYGVAVDVTGSPYLPLTLGGSGVNATYVSGSGTTALVFRYTVQAGDTDTDGVASASPLVLNGGTINKTGGSTAASLTFTPPATTSVLVDTTAPILSIGAPSASVTAGGPVTYLVTYSDTGFTSSTLSAGDITVNSTESATAGSVGVTGSGTTRTVTLSSLSGDGTLSIFIGAGTASDAAGNTAQAAGPSTAFTVDNTAPTVGVSAPSPSLTKGGPINFTVTYTDPQLDSNSITLLSSQVVLNKTGNVTVDSISVFGSGTTRTVQLDAISGDGSVGISVPANSASDLAGNQASGSAASAAATIDNTSPTVSVSAPSSSLTKSGPINFTVTYADAHFDAASITLLANQIVLNRTGGVTVDSISVSGSGATRTVQLDVISGDGTVGISIPANSASDLAGNHASASAASATATVDNTGPTVSVSAPSTSLTKSGPINFTVTYADSQFDAASITLLANQIVLNKTGGVTVDSISVSGSGATRTVQLDVISGDGTVGISIPANSASDLAGNHASASAASATAMVDNTSPAVSISAPSASLTTTASVSFTVTYNGAETITLGDSDVTVNGTGSASALATVSGSGLTTRTVALTGFSGHGTVGIALASGTAIDTAGNQAPASGPSTTFVLNAAPVAATDTVEHREGQSIKLAIADLLNNDTDADGDSVSFAGFETSGSNDGTIQRSGPWLVYTPPAVDAGDTFHYTIDDGRGGAATGLVLLTLAGPDNRQSQNILSVTPDGADQLIAFVGVPGLTYSVQYTLSLSSPNWQSLGLATAASNGAFSYRDVAPAEVSRFYRTVLP